MLIYRQVSPLHVDIADSWYSRLTAWIGKEILPREAHLIRPCRQVHTFGMNEPVDVIFLDRRDRAVFLIEDEQI